MLGEFTTYPPAGVMTMAHATGKINEPDVLPGPSNYALEAAAAAVA
jgi:hypothetical protein